MMMIYEVKEPCGEEGEEREAGGEAQRREVEQGEASRQWQHQRWLLRRMSVAARR